MAKYIGRGIEALRSWVRKCIEAGGTPTFVAEYAGRPLKGPDGSPALLVRCFGKADVVSGGTIYGLPADFVERVKVAKKDIQTLARELGL